MEFWVAVFGWLVAIAYVASMFYKPEWHFDFDRRVPQMRTLSLWWFQKGLPEWLLLVVRTSVMSGIVILFLRMCIRFYTNA